MQTIVICQFEHSHNYSQSVKLQCIDGFVKNKKEPQEFSVQNKERKLDKILALIDHEYGNANSIAFKKEIQSGA